MKAIFITTGVYLFYFLGLFCSRAYMFSKDLASFTTSNFIIVFYCIVVYFLVNKRIKKGLLFYSISFFFIYYAIYNKNGEETINFVFIQSSIYYWGQIIIMYFLTIFLFYMKSTPRWS